jgi:hypothetical protein
MFCCRLFQMWRSSISVNPSQTYLIGFEVFSEGSRLTVREWLFLEVAPTDKLHPASLLSAEAVI